jgi:spore germination cell wall hydrolase CwlJ-like protein
MLMARMILGEAENQPKEAKIGAGFTVLNRLKKQQSTWGFSVRGIILKDNQYDGLWNKNTYGKVRDPLSNASEKRKQEWSESYAVAKNVLSRSVVDTVPGSTNFHSYTDIKEFPFWATDKNYRGKIGKIYFYELEK